MPTDHYLEVIRAGSLPPASVTEVHLRSDFRNRLDELQARVIRGEDLDAVETNQVAAYDVVGRWHRDDGTDIVAVA